MKNIFILLAIILNVIINDVNAQSSENNKILIKMDHSHMPIAVPSHIEKPSLSLLLKKDTMSGYNLHVQIQSYRLMPPPTSIVNMTKLMSATVDKQTGFVEGHAHLYINGTKIQRIYGLDVHLPEKHFKEGLNTISVTLNNHGHLHWTVDDKKVVSTLYIDNNLKELIKHKFESFPVTNVN